MTHYPVLQRNAVSMNYPKRKTTKKELMKKIKYRIQTAIKLLPLIACFSACTAAEEPAAEAEPVVQTEQVQEAEPAAPAESAEEPADQTAPEGILKTYFLTCTGAVVPGDFTEDVWDDSEFMEGFRKAELLCEDPLTLEGGLPEWSASEDCYEETEVSFDTLQESFLPEKEGLYSVELVGADIYGNASVAKVYVLYIPEKAPTKWLEADGLQRAKAEEAFAKVNEQRVLHGRNALSWNETLYELACVRAGEISTSFSHQRPDGSYVGDVIIRQYGASGCGENLAENYRSVTNLINGWLGSAEHKENMLDSRFTQGAMACECRNGVYYWVNLFWQ